MKTHKKAICVISAVVLFLVMIIADFINLDFYMYPDRAVFSLPSLLFGIFYLFAWAFFSFSFGFAQKKLFWKYLLAFWLIVTILSIYLEIIVLTDYSTDFSNLLFYIALLINAVFLDCPLLCFIYPFGYQNNLIMCFVALGIGILMILLTQLAYRFGRHIDQKKRIAADDNPQFKMT